MGSLGKKKADKITRALNDFTSIDNDHAAVAGKHICAVKHNCRNSTVVISR